MIIIYLFIYFETGEVFTIWLKYHFGDWQLKQRFNRTNLVTALWKQA